MDPSAPGSHDEDYVYPIGFHTSRKHASCTNPGSKCLYHSEIVAGPSGKPHFKVTCADMSEHPYEDATPNVCAPESLHFSSNAHPLTHPLALGQRDPLPPSLCLLSMIESRGRSVDGLKD